MLLKVQNNSSYLKFYNCFFYIVTFDFFSLKHLYFSIFWRLNNIYYVRCFIKPLGTIGCYSKSWFFYPYGDIWIPQNQLDSLKVFFNTDTLSYNKKKSIYPIKWAKTTKNIPGFSSLTLWSQSFRSKPQFNLYISMEWCNLNRQSFSFFSHHSFTLDSSLSCLG